MKIPNCSELCRIALLGIVISVSLYSLPAQAEPVKITITLKKIRVLATDTDNLSDADLFSKVSIGAATFDNEDQGDQNELEGNNEITPDWEFETDIDRSITPSVPITIEIWDEDDGFNFDNNILDISNSPSRAGIALRLNLNTCIYTLTGVSGTMTNVTPATTGTSANCGTFVAVEGDGAPNDLQAVRLEFTIDVEVSNRTGNAMALRAQCSHAPLIPKTGEEISVFATAIGTGFTAAGFTSEIYYATSQSLFSPPQMNTAMPLQTCTTIPCVFQNVPAISARTFSYGCLVKDNSQTAWSGWKTVPIGVPEGSDPIPVLRTGPKSSSIDVVFIPDENSYESFDDGVFQNSVRNIIGAGFFGEDVFLRNQDNFNFWISRSSGTSADNDNSDCDHQAPDDWDETYGFAEVGVILHTWNTIQGGTAFRDCAPSGESYVSGASNAPRIILHEVGHTPFGLADEYCCNGGYWEPDEFPNVYEDHGPELLEDCRADLSALGRGDTCRLIVSAGTVVGASPLSTEFSTSEPMTNDLMNDNGTAQAADIRAIEGLISKCRGSQC